MTTLNITRAALARHEASATVQEVRAKAHTARMRAEAIAEIQAMVEHTISNFTNIYSESLERSLAHFFEEREAKRRMGIDTPFFRRPEDERIRVPILELPYYLYVRVDEEKVQLSGLVDVIRSEDLIPEILEPEFIDNGIEKKQYGIRVNAIIPYEILAEYIRK